MIARRLTVALVVTTACTLPARTFQDYEADAAAAAEDAVIHIGTALIAAQVLDRDGIPLSTASVVVGDAEVAATGGRGIFAGIQPPDTRADRLRERTLRLMDEALGVIERMRIAIRRGDVAAIRRLLPEAAAARDALDAFADAHGPA